MKTDKLNDPVTGALLRALGVMLIVFSAVGVVADRAASIPAECQDAPVAAITACDLELIAPGSTDGVLR